MLNKKVGIHQGIAHNGKWPMHDKHYKVGELISSTNSKTLGVNPHHCELVEKHFGVNEWPHHNLNHKE